MPKRHALSTISAIINTKGQNGERKKRSTWKLCPLVVLAPISRRRSLAPGAKPGCGIWEAQLKSELCPCLLSWMCAPQGSKSFGRNRPSHGPEQRENLRATWGRWGPEDSNGGRFCLSQSWGPWACAKRERSEDAPEHRHCSGLCRHILLTNSSEMFSTLGVTLLRLQLQTAVKQSKHQKYQPQKGALGRKMQPLFVWRDTEKAFTIIFSLAATFQEDSLE